MRFSLALPALLSSAALIGGCALNDRTTLAASAPAPVAGPAAELGSFGFDTQGMDRSVPPGDDFYTFANGNWSKTTAIPADKSNYGMFTRLDDLSRQRTREILEAAKGDANSKIGIAYGTYLDRAAIDAKGLAPIKPWLDKIKSTGKDGYAALVAEAARNGVEGPFSSFVRPDDKDPNVYSLYLGQSGIGMPDRDYYLSQEPKLAEARGAYLAHLAKVLEFAGEPDAAARAKAVVDFETKIAAAHWTQVQNRDAEKTYNRMSIAELSKSAPGFDFATYLSAIPVDTVVVAQPSAFAGIAKAIAEAPVGVLRDQMLVRSLDGFAAVLPSKFDEEQFAFYGTVLSGTPQQEDRWKRAVNFTTGALADDVSQVYVARYFPPATKAAADELVRNVTEAMGARIDALEWMTPETKAKARQKLAAFTPKIGYPDKWHDYSALKIVPGDAFGNALRANQWAYQDNIDHLGKPIQKWEWYMTPMTVNAYANPVQNEIVFPAAILQPPFFDPNADPAINYGGIGAVIGHEISHHFDDQGSKYDPSGALKEWWTPADVERFKALTANLVRQYDAYEPLPGLKVKGELTLGENIADLAGLTVAYAAYQKALGGRPAPVLDGFTGDQRFYLGWAQVWRRNYREPNLRQRLLTDPHSPSAQRVWVVRNLDPWYAAFKPVEGSKLYLPQAERVRIW